MSSTGETRALPPGWTILDAAPEHDGALETWSVEASGVRAREARRALAACGYVPTRRRGAGRAGLHVGYAVEQDRWVGVTVNAPVPSGARAGRRRATRGFTVAVLGPDGAGKTTLADNLRATAPIETACVYLGIWRQNRLERALRPVFGAQLALRLAKLLLKSIAIEHHKLRGRLVVLDRYTCDADLPRSTADVWGRISARLTRLTCRAPDVLLLLDAPVEVMYARKGEHGVDELQQRRDAYLAMRDRFPQMHVIDVSQPADDVRREATRVIWSRWARACVRRRGRPRRSA